MLGASRLSRQLQTKAVFDATENVEAVVSFASAEGDARGEGGEWAVSRTRHVGSNDTAFRDCIDVVRNSDGSFQDTAPKNHQEYCTTLLWRCWFSGSQ